MIVRTRKGFYVYSKPSVFGRRRRVAGPFTSKAVAKGVNKSLLKKKKKRKR